MAQTRQRFNIPHGFTLNGIGILVLGIILLWGIRTENKVLPIIQSDVKKINNLNKLQKVDIKCGCGTLNLKCSGSL